MRVTRQQFEQGAKASRLRPISERAVAWLKGKFTPEVLCTPKRGLMCCAECGEHIAPKEFAGVCPHCGRRLDKFVTKYTHLKTDRVGLVFAVSGRWQVLRLLLVRKTVNKGRPAEWFAAEVAQSWICENGQIFMRRRPYTGMGYARDWQFGAPLATRKWDRNDPGAYFLDNTEYVLPRPRIMPALIRHGMMQAVRMVRRDNLRLTELLSGLLADYRVESLWKNGQREAAYNLAIHPDYGALWPQMKIAMRHKYIITNFQYWSNTVLMLADAGLDDRNPCYICSGDIDTLHDSLLKRKHREQWKEEARKAAEKDGEYRKMRGQLLGIVFAGNGIEVSSLDSVQAIFREGEAMHHCIYKSGYYRRQGSLLLSAKVGGVRMETIEVDLRTMKVVQSRGPCNQPTQWHEAIVSLVEQNIAVAVSKAAAV